MTGRTSNSRTNYGMTRSAFSKTIKALAPMKALQATNGAMDCPWIVQETWLEHLASIFFKLIIILNRIPGVSKSLLRLNRIALNTKEEVSNQGISPHPWMKSFLSQKNKPRRV